MRSTRALVIAGSAVVVLMAACGGGNGVASPTTAFPTGIPSNIASLIPTGLPTGIPSSIASLIPSGIPTGNAGGLTEGTANLAVSGDATATVNLTTLKTGTYKPGLAIALAWADTSGNTFTIAGLAFTGSATTSTTLTLSFSITSPTLLIAASTAGECTIALSEASESHVKGTADCENLQVSGKSVNLHVDFEATG
ncbi:MAG: hypothetical protein ACJ77A_17290 [Actinomycetota bacterium]